MVIQKEEPAYTTEAIYRVLQILDITYAKSEIDKVSAAAYQIEKINGKSY